MIDYERGCNFWGIVFPVFLWDQKFNKQLPPKMAKSPALQDLAKAHSEVAFYEEVLSKSQLKSGRLKSCP